MEIFFNIINVSTVFCDKGFMTLQNKSINFLIKKKNLTDSQTSEQ